MKIHFRKREIELSKRMIIEIIASIAIVFAIIIAVFWYFFKPICPDIDWRINRTTNFELFVVSPNYFFEENPTAKNILATSKNMNTEQKAIVYNYIKKIKKLDVEKQLRNYNQSTYDNLIRIMFDNGIILYFQPNVSIYSNENKLTDAYCTADSTEFDNWFMELHRFMKDFTEMSDGVLINRYYSIMSPDKLLRIKGDNIIEREEWDENDAIELPKKEYTGEMTFDGDHNLTSKQLMEIQSKIETLGRAGINYDFSSPKNILTDDMFLYMGLRSNYYYDIMVDINQKTRLSESQIVKMYTEEFSFDQYTSYNSENLQDKDGRFVLSTQRNGFKTEILEVYENIGTIVVFAMMYPSGHEESSVVMDKPKKIRYTFSFGEPFGDLKLISGEEMWNESNVIVSKNMQTTIRKN